MQDMISYRGCGHQCTPVPIIPNGSVKRVYSEPFPDPVCCRVCCCTDAMKIHVGDTKMLSHGRIVQVDTWIRKVCPGKRVAAAIILEELDCCGRAHPRGIKTMLIPAHYGSCCEDVQVQCVNFVLPEELDECGCTENLCNSRKFQVRILANYVDTDFVCCQEDATIE